MAATGSEPLFQGPVLVGKSQARFLGFAHATVDEQHVQKFAQFRFSCPVCSREKCLDLNVPIDINIDDLIEQLLTTSYPSYLWENTVRVGLMTQCPNTECSSEYEVRFDELHRQRVMELDS